MKTIITLIAILSLCSCSVSRGVKVKELTPSAIITAKNDTIPTRSRLLGMLESGKTYNLHILNNRCVDASWPSKKKLSK